MEIERVSVIGLGLMGTPIASFLLKTGYQVSGFDVKKGQVTNLVPLGLKPSMSARAAARGADLILLSLPNWEVVKDVVEGKSGLLPVLKKGQIIADTSTVPPWETTSMAKKLLKMGVCWMDVPVSGSAAEAREGDLVFMAGGPRSIFKKIKPVLDKVGRKTVYVGKNGQGSMLKLIVNHTLFLNQAAAVEGLTLARKSGIDPDLIYDVMISGAARSSLIVQRGQDMLRHDFKGKGALAVAVKDIGLCLENARRLGAAAPMAALYQQFLLSASRRGWKDMDATSVMKIFEELAG
jgi:3-hydroxyisobutyrate dehydrogenase-like beta-hydroxyacid dehydrogenase